MALEPLKEPVRRPPPGIEISAEISPYKQYARFVEYGEAVEEDRM